MRVGQAAPVARATRARPVTHLVPVTQTRVARWVAWALDLERPRVRLRVATGIRPAVAVETRPAIEVEIPPATGADTPRVIAEA